jgi:hypothetical protein
MIPFKFYTRSRIFKYYTGFAFFIFIWVSKLARDEDRITNHEIIHFRQQVEMLFLPHWILYLWFYFFCRIKGQDHFTAYRNNPFEREAYGHDFDLAYLKKRKLYAWVKYMK